MLTTFKKSKEQKGAEAEVESFRKDLGPFVVAAETTRMAMVFTDAKEPGNPIIFANDSFLALTGYEREELLGRSINFLVDGGADPQTRAQVAAVFGDRADSGADICCRRNDGAAFGPLSLVIPCATRPARSCSISPHSWISANTRRPKSACGFSWTN
jgi:PAS domain-containing protein